MKRLPKGCIARLLEKLPKRNGEARALEDSGDAEHNVVPHRVSHRFGMSDVFHAFVKRQPSADAEDQHSDDQAPEVQLFAVPERMLGRGRPLAQLEAHEQEDAVQRVDRGVDAFGQHRRTARDAGDHELGDRDGHVGGDRAIDRNPGVRHEDRVSKSLRWDMLPSSSHPGAGPDPSRYIVGTPNLGPLPSPWRPLLCHLITLVRCEWRVWFSCDAIPP